MKISFLNKLKLSCCEATLLMEQQNANAIGFTNSIKLKSHILICKWCEAYNRKLKVIDSKLSHEKHDENIEIDDVELNDLKNKINKKLNL